LNVLRKVDIKHLTIFPSK